MYVPRRVIAFPRDEDVPAPPVFAHRPKMLPRKVTAKKVWLPAILAGFWRDSATPRPETATASSRWL
jgi:hypothetical protein